MMKSLGILVTSDAQGDNLSGIVLAAARKGIATCIHLEGSAVRLCLQKNFHAICTHARISASRASAERLGLTGQIKARHPGLLTSSGQPRLNIVNCQRHIVL